jgi:Ca2+-binding EF-hand superfamily protein
MKLQTVAGFTLEQIEDGRKAFMKLSDGSSGELSLGQLVDAGVVETIVELLGFTFFDDLMAKLDQDKNGKLNFEEFMIGIQRCTVDNVREDSFCSQLLFRC